MEASIAHVKKADGGYSLHPLEDHLSKVADLAAQKARFFCSQDWASIAGIWHDLGKFSEAFQHYIKSASGYNTEAHIEAETKKGKVNHSDAGALYAVEQFGVYGRILAYLIAGHHAGLPDWHKLDAHYRNTPILSVPNSRPANLSSYHNEIV